MQDIAADGDGQAGEIVAGLPSLPQRMAQGQRVQQGLGRVFVLAITRIEDRAVDLVRDKARRPARSVPDDDGIGAHGVEGDRGIDQRLALLHAGLRGVHVDDVGAQPLPGDLETQERPRRVLEESIDDRQSGQAVAVLLALPVEIDPLFRLVEQEQDFVALQLADAEQVAMREGLRSRRIAGCVGLCLRSCH